MRPIGAIACLAAALERGEDVNELAAHLVQQVKDSGPHAPYIAPVPESLEDDTSVEEINRARAARGLDPL